MALVRSYGQQILPGLINGPSDAGTAFLFQCGRANSILITAMLSVAYEQLSGSTSCTPSNIQCSEFT